MLLTALPTQQSVLITTLLVLFAASLVAGSQSILSWTPNGNSSEGTRIAVIGAGAGGTAFSYYLQRYSAHHFNITVFESSGYVGGRSTTIGNYVSGLKNITDTALLNSDVELGGSVFVDANLIMMSAKETFNLSFANDSMEQYPELFKQSVGIWDGERFTLWMDTSTWYGSIWTTLKLLYRYNISLFKIQRDIKSLIASFLKHFYYSDFPFHLETVVNASGLVKFTNSVASDYLSLRRYNSEFMSDIMEPATRVNYRSDLDEIHAFGAYISMAASRTYAIAGGNYLVFENFLEKSEANVLLNTQVTEISHNADGTYDVSYGNQSSNFDQVVIAAPFQFTGIEVSNVDVDFSTVEYRPLYASYIEAPVSHRVDPSKFGTDTVPDMILTAKSDVPFFSCNIVDYDNVTETVRYKVFSEGGIDEDFLLENLFDDTTDVRVLFQKEWFPYPLLQTTSNFDGFEVHQGLWYLNSMERFISTMETSALAGASVAGQIAMSYGFNESIVVP